MTKASDDGLHKVEALVRRTQKLLPRFVNDVQPTLVQAGPPGFMKPCLTRPKKGDRSGDVCSD